MGCHVPEQKQKGKCHWTRSSFLLVKGSRGVSMPQLRLSNSECVLGLCPELGHGDGVGLLVRSRAEEIETLVLCTFIITGKT